MLPPKATGDRFHSQAQMIVARRHPGYSLEFAGKARPGQRGSRDQVIDTDFLPQLPAQPLDQLGNARGGMAGRIRRRLGFRFDSRRDD